LLNHYSFPANASLSREDSHENLAVANAEETSELIIVDPEATVIVGVLLFLAYMVGCDRDCSRGFRLLVSY
jgi:hypothetical protein